MPIAHVREAARRLAESAPGAERVEENRVEGVPEINEDRRVVAPQRQRESNATHR
jgi:hypothetical protein